MMTENEMKKRMNEINQEEKKLRLERDEYEKYFHNKKRRELLNNHNKFIGKCFAIKNNQENKYKNVKSFKILRALSKLNEYYAECIVLIESENNCLKGFGVQLMELPIWAPNEIKLINKESDPKIIDFYEEITQEDFNGLYRAYKQKIEDKVF